MRAHRPESTCLTGDCPGGGVTDHAPIVPGTGPGRSCWQPQADERLGILAPAAKESGQEEETVTRTGNTVATSRALMDAAATVLGSVISGLLLVLLLGGGWLVQGAGVVVGLVVPTVAAISILRRTPPASTGADRVTLFRGVLTGACATVVVLSLADVLPPRSWPLFALALPALLLDAVDGWLARRSNNASPSGGRLDMETDAVFLMILSIPLVWSVGPWALGIGAMRYLFVAASWLRPALRQKLAFSQFRRVVAGIQGVVLVSAVMPVMPVSAAAVATWAALLLLGVSFGKDVVTLERARSEGS